VLGAGLTLTKIKTLKMDKLLFELRQLTNRNRDGSQGRQAERYKELRLMSQQLRRLGYKKMGAKSLKTKHVQALLKHWKVEKSPQTGKPISIGTIKNRMSSLRWWAEKVNKSQIIPRTNKELGLPDRKRLPDQSKAFSLEGRNLSKLPRHIVDSLRLQEAFGLRREESAKFQPGKALNNEKLDLKASWTKGGRARSIPMVNEEQRQLVKELVNRYGNNSLIPAQMNYKEYLSHRGYHISSSELPSSHGLRHQYAQLRYEELTGWPAPINGGPKKADMSLQEQKIDHDARATVSRELGHKRISITRIYLG